MNAEETSTDGKPVVVLIVGTRPELIKMAGTIEALRALETIDSLVVFTGQHHELMDSASRELDIHPDVTLDRLPKNRQMTELLGHTILELGRVLAATDIACFVIQGDTVSALAGALVSELMDRPLVHIEAGVRSNFRNDPFPEETIRRMISSITERHICFTEAARSQLIAEGYSASDIALVPHPLKERTLRGTVAPMPSSDHLVLITLHRRERRTLRFEKLVAVISDLRAAGVDAKWVFVWHPSLDQDMNRFRSRFDELGIEVREPYPPNGFIELLASSTMVITDSAGVSEEAHLMAKPLLIFRTSAEPRITDDAVAPTCISESPDVAREFLYGHLSERPQQHNVVSQREEAVRSGTVIASQIVDLATAR